MGRRAAFAFAAIVGLLLTGCYGPFGQTGVSLPNAIDDGQTVTDAADALVAHGASATDNARAAIAVTDAVGSFVRDVGRDEHALTHASLRRGLSYTSVQLARATGGRVFSASQLLMRPALGTVSAFCESTAGMSLNGIPSLDASFGWQTGAYAGGTRTTNGGAFATWSATVTGAAVQAPIGQLGVARHDSDVCPMMGPAFTIDGGRYADAFSIPIALTYRNGNLWDVSVSGGSFVDNERLDVTTSPANRFSVSGVITKGDTELGSFALDAHGKGTLTVTSTGAQYRVSDWIVVGI